MHLPSTPLALLSCVMLSTSVVAGPPTVSLHSPTLAPINQDPVLGRTAYVYLNYQDWGYPPDGPIPPSFNPVIFYEDGLPESIPQGKSYLMLSARAVPNGGAGPLIVQPVDFLIMALNRSTGSSEWTPFRWSVGPEWGPPTQIPITCSGPGKCTGLPQLLLQPQLPAIGYTMGVPLYATSNGAPINPVRVTRSRIMFRWELVHDGTVIATWDGTGGRPGNLIDASQTVYEKFTQTLPVVVEYEQGRTGGIGDWIHYNPVFRIPLYANPDTVTGSTGQSTSVSLSGGANGCEVRIDGQKANVDESKEIGLPTAVSGGLWEVRGTLPIDVSCLTVGKRIISFRVQQRYDR